MIKLTLLEGDAVYVSPELIVAAYDGGEATTLFIGGDEAYSVKESPEEVARKVLEYKLSVIRFAGAYSAAVRLQHGDPETAVAFLGSYLDFLAGLEESQ